jgi:hypothetical protein
VGPTTNTLTWLAGFDLYACWAATAVLPLACTHTLLRLLLNFEDCCWLHSCMTGLHVLCSAAPVAPAVAGCAGQH